MVEQQFNHTMSCPQKQTPGKSKCIEKLKTNKYEVTNFIDINAI